MEQKISCTKGICKETGTIESELNNIYNEDNIINKINRDLMNDFL